MTITVLTGDCRDVLPYIPSRSINCVASSPPYFGLRDYGVGGQIGLEQTPDEYVAEMVMVMVMVFREVRRTLRDDGTLWLNLGDSYANDGKWGGSTGGKHAKTLHAQPIGRSERCTGLKPKDLIGIPWRVAFALQADGWYLRQDIIWHKPNPMPESVRDRCTKAHEYIFMFSKSARYYYDIDAIAEPTSDVSLAWINQANFANQKGGEKDYLRTGQNANRSMRKTLENFAASVGRTGKSAFRGQGHFRDGTGPANRNGRDMREIGAGKPTRNRRSVWTVSTKPFKEAHFATFPPDLIEPCILAGCPEGGTVLDPFFGAGTTGLVAQRNGRKAIGIELNPEYVAIAKRRLGMPGSPQDVDLFS